MKYPFSIMDYFTKLHTNSLNSFKRPAECFIMGNYNKETRITPIMEGLQFRHHTARCTMMYQVANNIIDIPLTPLQLVHQAIRRHAQKFPQPTFYIRIYQVSLIPAGIVLWHLLPQYIIAAVSLNTISEDQQS